MKSVTTELKQTSYVLSGFLPRDLPVVKISPESTPANGPQ